MVDAIKYVAEEPERFAEKIDLKKIEIARDHQKEFLKEMAKRWNQKGGFYLWQYLAEQYDAMNVIFNSKTVQRVIKKRDLDRDTFKNFIKNFNEKQRNYQKRIERNILRKRERGVVIPKHTYTTIQKRFIEVKKEMPLYLLANEFNRNFNTRLSRNAIRDKRLRIFGRKK